MDDAARAPLSERSSYGANARIMGVGIGVTGLVTFAYFAVASHVLTPEQYGPVSLLWSVLFVVMSVIYRPIEQLLSRTIADARARGAQAGPLRGPMLLQAGFAAVFFVAALVLEGPIEELFEGSSTLFWIFVVSALAYAASYFARGYLAGHGMFALYGGLVLFEALARILFPIAVAVGIASGQTAVAMGIVAAPFASLLVVPFAIRRHSGDAAAAAQRASAREGAGFAGSVAAIQLAEQTVMNAAVLLVPGAVLPGVVFNALLVARAPLQLFQSVQTTLLPHLAGLEATEGREAFDRAIRQTVLVIAAFAGAVALGLLAIGPWAMELLFDSDVYGRWGLVLVAVGMGLHLTAGTFTQAALARGRAHVAAGMWLACAVAFVLWMVLGVVDDELLRAESGYALAAALLCVLLRSSYRAPRRSSS